MSLLEIAKADVERITTDITEWAVLMTFKTPTSGPFDFTFDVSFNNSEYVTLKGTHTKHHLGINGETGQKINTKTASITISEIFLTENNYPVRIEGEVNLQNHQVAVKDSSGVVCTYLIREWYPDETLGLIVCILGDME